MRPFYVYDNWSAYDELSDNVPLTEELALFQLGEMKRLMRYGVTFDAYLMDAFWYEGASGYRTWKHDRWPNGPDRWLDEVKAAGLEAGLWFPANTAFHLLPEPEAWKDSLSGDGWGFCCFEGGFLDGFMDVLRDWYDHGVTVFKFDFADFGAAPEAIRKILLPSEIRQRNINAYRDALLTFRQDCPNLKLLAYNGFEEADFMSNTYRPVRKSLDPAWLDVFDSVYSGDPRPADVPQPNFWRTLDIYADHMVRYLNLGGLRFEQIDNCALMLGKCGTCYARGVESWKTTAVLSLARKGNVHMTLGNLELLTDEDAEFFAYCQRLFEGVPAPEWIGGLPGERELYGYQSGRILTLVNPSLFSTAWPSSGELLYSDGKCDVCPDHLLLGPGAVAVLDTSLPTRVVSMPGLSLAKAVDLFEGSNPLEATIEAPFGDLHIGFTQSNDLDTIRTSGGPPPDGTTMAQLLTIEVCQGDRQLAVLRSDDKALWSGLSWAYGVVSADQMEPDKPLRVRFSSSDPAVTELVAFVLRGEG